MHVGTDLFSLVLANNNMGVQFDAPDGVGLVTIGGVTGASYRVIALDLIDPAHPWRHSSDKLAHALLELV